MTFITQNLGAKELARLLDTGVLEPRRAVTATTVKVKQSHTHTHTHTEPQTTATTEEAPMVITKGQRATSLGHVW